MYKRPHSEAVFDWPKLPTPVAGLQAARRAGSTDKKSRCPAFAVPPKHWENISDDKTQRGQPTSFDGPDTQPRQRHTQCLPPSFSTPRPSRGYVGPARALQGVKSHTDVGCGQRRGEALRVNISAGEGLQDVLKSNLGPLGTIKM